MITLKDVFGENVDFINKTDVMFYLKCYLFSRRGSDVAF